MENHDVESFLPFKVKDDESCEITNQKTSFLDHRTIQIIFLVSGAMKPIDHIFSQLWYIPWIGWRMLLIFTAVMEIVVVFTGWIKIPTKLVFWYFFPVSCGTISSLYILCVFPKLIKTINSDNDSYHHYFTEKEIKQAITLSLQFMTFFLTCGIVITILRYLETQNIFYALIDASMAWGVTPILSCILLTLSLDTRIAKKEVQTLVISALKQTLTRKEYMNTREIIRKRAMRWTTILAVIGFVSIWNSIGLIISVNYTIGKRNIFHHGDDNDVSKFELELLMFVALTQETVVLFLILFMIMGINDEVDSITSILIQQSFEHIENDDRSPDLRVNSNDDGDEGVDVDDAGGDVDVVGVEEDESDDEKENDEGGLEVTRFHLLLLNTTYAIQPEALGSWWSYLTLFNIKPVGFTVFGVRITRQIALAALLSLFISLLSTTFNTFLTY